MNQKNKCKFCNGTKTANYLPGSKTIVWPGHEKEMQSQLSKLDAGKLEQRPCPACKKVEKITKVKTIKNANINRKSKRVAKNKGL